VLEVTPVPRICHGGVDLNIDVRAEGTSQQFGDALQHGGEVHRLSFQLLAVLPQLMGSRRPIRVAAAAVRNLSSPNSFGINDLLQRDVSMGRGILLWLLGIPIPIIILLALFWH
jgi:hypothetical protein